MYVPILVLWDTIETYTSCVITADRGEPSTIYNHHWHPLFKQHLMFYQLNLLSWILKLAWTRVDMGHNAYISSRRFSTFIFCESIGFMVIFPMHFQCRGHDADVTPGHRYKQCCFHRLLCLVTLLCVANLRSIDALTAAPLNRFAG